MTRDYLTRAFEAERRQRALGQRHAHPRRRYPRWMAYPQARPVGRRERAAADDPWTQVKVIVAGMALLVLCAWLAGQMPERRVPPDPRGYTLQP